MMLQSSIIFVLTIYSAIKITETLQCHKCYRIEECESKNCSSLYGLLDKTYRDHFFIQKSDILPICPAISDESAWRKLEVDGHCGSKTLRHQPCAVAHFQVDGLSLGKAKLNGVFLGCPQVWAEPLLPESYRCVIERSYSKAYKNGIVHPRNMITDLRLRVTLCHTKCVRAPSNCTLCFSDGCIHPNRTLIKEHDDDPGVPLSITWTLVAMSAIVLISFLLASYCHLERLGRLDVIMSEDGTIHPYK